MEIKSLRFFLAETYYNIRKVFRFMLDVPKMLSGYMDTHAEIKREFGDKLVGFLPCEALGTYILFAEMHARQIDIRNYNPKYDAVILGSNFTVNRQLCKMYERVLNIVKNDDLYKKLVSGGMRYLKTYRHALPVYNNGTDVCRLTNVPYIRFTEDETRYGWHLLDRLGISPEDKIVTISNRDEYYWNKHRSENKSWDSYRNSRFDTALGSIEFLRKEGYKIIRSGHYPDNTDEALPYLSLNRFNADEKDFLDIFIHSICRFSVNTNSGITYLPYAFRKTQLIYNCIGEIPAFDYGIILPKVLKFKNNGRLINPGELARKRHWTIYAEREYFRASRMSIYQFRANYLYKSYGIEIVDNTDEEILNAVKEASLFAEGRLYLSQDDMNLQEHYKRLFPIDHPMRHFCGIISPAFLKKYPEITA